MTQSQLIRSHNFRRLVRSNFDWIWILVLQVWLVGDKLDDAEQRRASKGMHIIPFSQFPPKKLQKNSHYYSTPAMKIPQSLENMHYCEVILMHGCEIASYLEISILSAKLNFESINYKRDLALTNDACIP